MFEPVVAFAGPHIKQCCYNVGMEFIKLFPRSTTLMGGKVFMDLLVEVKLRIKIPVVDFSICTYCSNIYHSYRRGSNKRNYAFIYKVK